MAIAPNALSTQIRELSGNGQFDSVDQLIAEGLKSEPTNVELLAEKARLLLYRAREQEALNLILPLPLFQSTREVAQILANFFRCRLIAGSGGVQAKTALANLENRFSVTPDPSCGVRVSACLIVRNESGNLPRCLSSLKGAVDEIIVVDTGSTDDTVAIAESFDATIGHFAWCGDFSAARNVSLGLAKGNWILWIDADEELAPEAAKLLRNAVQRPQFGGFSLEIVNYTADGENTSQYIHNPIRLFQNLPSVRFSGRIHEQICEPLKALGLPGATLENARILHHGYRPAEMAKKGKVERTIDLLQKEVLNHPSEPFHWFNLCNALFVATRWAEAEHAGRQCARFCSDGDSYGLLNYQLMIGAMAAQNKLMPALRACDEANARGFTGILIDFERANIHLRANEAVEALEAIDRCMNVDWPEGMTGDHSIHLYKRHIVRGQALAILGRFVEAVSMFDHALSIVPTNGTALYSKAATLEKMSEWPLARELFLAGRADASLRQVCSKGAARVTLRLGLAKESAELYREAWEADPEDYDCWVGWTEAANAWGDSEMIVTAYESFVKRHQPTAEILVNWGRALNAAGQPDRALALFTEAMQREPGSSNAYFNCGDLLYSLGQYHDAAHIYQSGLRADPNHVDGWFVLGNCFARLGMDDGARLAYSQALILDPRHQGATHNLTCLAA